MRSELKSYSNLVDNRKGINNFKSAIDKLTSGNISKCKTDIYLFY